MAKKLALLLVCFLILAAYRTQAQDDDDDYQTDGHDDQTPPPRRDTEEEYTLKGQEQVDQQEMYRANLVSCILLHRHEFSAHNNDLTEIFKNRANGNEIYKKMVGEYMYNCFGQIQYHESQKIMEQLQSKRFDFTNFKYITNFDYEKYKDSDLDLELTADEKRLVEYVEEFEKQMKEQHGEQQPQNDDEDSQEEMRGSKIIDTEPRIFGYSLRNLPGSYILGYVIVLIISVICGLYCAFTKLLTPPKTMYEKIKESSDKKKKNKKNQ